jgi:hypothetical protein
LYVTANVQENVILHYTTFYFSKTNLKFLTAEKIRLIGRVVFAPRTQTYATDLKEYGIVMNLKQRF